MTPTPSDNLERLLEQLGSNEIPGSTQHRYALRRALLNSSTFEANRVSARWYHVFTITGSVLAGGLVVVVISVTAIGPLRSLGSATPVAEVQVEAEAFVVEDRGRTEPSALVLPQVEFVDFSQFVSTESVDNWMPRSVEYATSR